MIPGGREVHRTLRLAASVLGLVVVVLVTLGIALLAMVAGGAEPPPVDSLRALLHAQRRTRYAYFQMGRDCGQIQAWCDAGISARPDECPRARVVCARVAREAKGKKP